MVSIMTSTPPGIAATQSGSRKWRAVLMLAILYGIGITFKFTLIVLHIQLDVISSFDDTLKWAMAGMSAAVSAYITATGLEDYAKYRGPTMMPQQAENIVNAAPQPVAVVESRK